MYKKGLFVLVLVLLSLAFTSFVSASQSVVVSEVNENLTAVYVQNPLNFYSYEVNFNIDLGESYHVDFANVFGGGTTRGSALDGDSILSVYESKLGDAGAGFGDGTGTYNLFNVTHYGGLSLYDSLLVGNNKSEDRPAYCGNGLIETGEQCDGSNMTSCVARGYGGGVLTCNSDCTANTSKCTGIYTPPADTTGGRGGSGGAALGNLVNVSDVKLEVNPSELNINVVSGQESRRSISIKNIGSNKVTLDLVLAGLNAESGFDSNNLTLEPGEKKSINFVLRDLQKGLYVGQVLVRYNGQTVKSVLLTINTKSANFLFNISVSVPGFFKNIAPGKDLSARISLNEVGSKNQKVDVEADYVIKDFSGKNYLVESETFAVQGEKDFIKQFNTKDLPNGRYVLGVIIRYSGAYATASSDFTVGADNRSKGYLYVVLVVMVVAVLVLAVIAVNKRNKGRLVKIRRRN